MKDMIAYSGLHTCLGSSPAAGPLAAEGALPPRLPPPGWYGTPGRALLVSNNIFENCCEPILVVIPRNIINVKEKSSCDYLTTLSTEMKNKWY
jgi:hypothetical protein